MNYFIVNPASRSGIGKHIWKEVKTILKREGFVYHVYKTTKERNATVVTNALLKKHPQGDIKLFVLGGDGTINEVLQGFSEKDFSRVSLAYIPTGSSNDLARALNYSDNLEETVLQLINSKDTRTMDLGLLSYNKCELNNNPKRYFIVSAGIGFDASVCQEAMNSTMKDKLNKYHLGKLSYGSISLKQLLSIPPLKCSITIDDNEAITLNKCYFVCVMNHCYQGGGIKFCPDAVDNDGILDICFAADISKARILYSLPFAFSGKHVGMKGIGNMTCKKVKIDYEEPLWVHTDGEVKTKASSIVITCHKDKLKFVI